MKLQPHKLTTVLVAAAAGLALTACGASISEPSMTTQPSASEASDSSTEATPVQDEATTKAASIDEKPKGEYSTEPTEKFGEAYGELRTTDIRVGSHDGFDRLVFEFEGTGDPQYHIGYNDDPRQQASGFPLEVPGNAKLEINIHGTSGDMSADAKYAGKKELGLASGNIVDVINGGSFEADSQYVVGLINERPYQVQVLHEPTRLVVDFQN
ncbi:hypothetical protein [uncultured Corynebacterium sp.]|uniref:AMIN-like domain-containing (lipo)protein n=1 Tax=uncultured Corynebacterium sp. TaxID=159447 RepID=UPI002635DF5A|nr:hypothetical protein [uncultured Corynebacterium sp.]